MAGEINGEVWEWHTGTGWKKVPGSESAGPNGLEISEDGKWLYIGGWGSQSFIRLSRGQTPVKRDSVSGWLSSRQSPLGPGRYAACRWTGRVRAFADIERCEGQSDHAEGPGTHSPPQYRRVRRHYRRHSGRQRTLARFGTRRSHRDLSARPVTTAAVNRNHLHQGLGAGSAHSRNLISELHLNCADVRDRPKNSARSMAEPIPYTARVAGVLTLDEARRMAANFALYPAAGEQRLCGAAQLAMEALFGGIIPLPRKLMPRGRHGIKIPQGSKDAVAFGLMGQLYGALRGRATSSNCRLDGRAVGRHDLW